MRWVAAASTTFGVLWRKGSWSWTRNLGKTAPERTTHLKLKLFTTGFPVSLELLLPLNIKSRNHVLLSTSWISRGGSFSLSFCYILLLKENMTVDCCSLHLHEWQLLLFRSSFIIGVNIFKFTYYIHATITPILVPQLQKRQPLHVCCIIFWVIVPAVVVP